MSVDPISAQRLHVNDVKRVIRALVVYLSSGKPLSAQNNEFVDQSSKKFKRDAIVIGLKWERCVLRERIKKRVDIMLSQGLVEEARALYDAAQDHSHPSYKGLGYSQLFKFFSGEYLFDEAVERIKIETAQYAKRQMTWFRGMEKRGFKINWIPFDLEENQFINQAMDLINKF